jgi:hypothetical protein
MFFTGCSSSENIRYHHSWTVNDSSSYSVISKLDSSSNNSVSIFGHVVETKTMEPVIGVNVKIVGIDKYETNTNVDGYYEQKKLLPGIYEIKYSRIGYNSITILHADIKKGQSIIIDVKLGGSYLWTE